MLNKIVSMKHFPNILGDGISYMDHLDFSEANLNDENRLNVITGVASVCYQSSKSFGSESLYNRLMAEAGGLPSSSFEFVPMLLTKEEFEDTVYNVDEHLLVKNERDIGFQLNLEKYGEWVEDGRYLLTNFRAAVYDKEQYGDLCDFTKKYNTKEECKIIKKHFNVFCVHVDMPTLGQMVRHRVNWQVLCISEHSKITTLQGTRTIKELYDNQFRKSPNKLPKIRTYDFTEKRIVWSEIKEVFKSGKKPVYELVVQNGSGGNKSKIKSTEFHKFFTNNGWKELKDIKVGDFVARNGVHLLSVESELINITKKMIENKVPKKDFAEMYNISELALVRKLQSIDMVYSDLTFEITNYHLKDWILEHKKLTIEKGLNLKEFAASYGINLNTLNKWLRCYNITYSKEELSKLKKPAWNKGITGEKSHSYGVKFSEDRIGKMREGRKNDLGDTKSGWAFQVRSFWKGKTIFNKILNLHQNKCCKCGETDISTIELDHIKPVRLYPELAYDESNIQPLCKNCHDIKTFEEEKIDNHTYKFGFVESITYIGEEETYDLEVDHPDHNYVANGLIVHNSRRYVSGERVPFEFYIAEKMKDVVSTFGGEDYAEDYGVNLNTQDVINMCVEHYRSALAKGIKPQVARGIIPQCAYTLAWCAFQPRQLENFFKMRCDSHAQWEIRQFAEKMEESVRAGFMEIKLSPEREAELVSRLKDYAENGVGSTLTKEEMLALLDSDDEDTVKLMSEAGTKALTETLSENVLTSDQIDGLLDIAKQGENLNELTDEELSELVSATIVD